MWERLLHGGDHAGGGIQERQHKVAGHHPAEEVGEEHHRLIRLGGEAEAQLREHNGEGDGNDQPQHDPQGVVAQGVAQHDRHIRGIQEFEIIQPHPLALIDVVPEGVGLVCAVILERQHNAEHRQIAQQHQPYRAGHDHCQQPEILLESGAGHRRAARCVPGTGGIVHDRSLLFVHPVPIIGNYGGNFIVHACCLLYLVAIHPYKARQ